ncbi:MAG: valine--tRNA ligase [Verrucomicrobia bacterium]|nr:MAG: valine--tRNA ligase [Verrucomicrobiota bacterium]
MPELPKTYDPNAVEPKWYACWEEAGYFRADAHSPKPPYSIVIPPPNITGILTLGHVLNNTIQDILARRARMQGFEVLWLPGTDHAGVGTQTAVEKHLRKTENKTRHDVGREEFLRRVVDWQDKHGGIIIKQLKRLGCSCDWSRQRYTFDDGYVRSVENVFVELYRRGYIYRGRRMINWDPAAQTALSDEEVISQPQKGKLYYVRYEIVEEPGRFLEVATTRPETIMADTAVAVYPDDPRYRDLIGKQVWRPLAREKLPVVGDAAIDPKFGTGVLKVTPAHDKVDFEIGVRHSLPVIDVLHRDGRINCPAVPELDGLDRFAARQKAAELLSEAKLLTKEEPHENSVGFSQRSEVPIEPRLSEQWFLRYPKTKEALTVVRDHLIRFFPQHWEKVYAQWLENIQDWCISRQIWWGHRIPAWYAKSEIRNPKSEIYVGIDPPADTENWIQDPDTLDTWFSSWLWAYETMDEETRRKFYPTAVLVTAPDIIFFWVARMIIAGLELRPGKSEGLEDNIPFHDVFLTGLIRDKQGRKMSKSLGNSPDPLDLIAKFGADGLRFGLMRIAPSGQDIAFDEKQIEEGRNFATKLWNAARFRQMHGPSDPAPKLDEASLSIYSIEVLARFNELLTAVEDAYREYKFNDVAQRLYDFFWGDYCDWFVEAAKTDIFAEDDARKKSVLAVMDFVLSGFLRLLHPFMPHITEELWSIFGFGAPSIQFQPFPQQSTFTNHDRVAEARMSVKTRYDFVTRIRTARAQHKVPSKKRIPVIYHHLRPTISDEDWATIARLANIDQPRFVLEHHPAKGEVSEPVPFGGWIHLDFVTDPAAERNRVEKEISRIEEELRTVEAKLSNASFVERAPAAVVEEHRKRKADFTDQLTQLRQARAAMD